MTAAAGDSPVSELLELFLNKDSDTVSESMMVTRSHGGIVVVEVGNEATQSLKLMVALQQVYGNC